MKELTKDLPRGWKAALARHCKIEPPSVSDWVSGRTVTLEGKNLIKAAEFFNVNPSWLATGKGGKEISGEHVFSVNETKARYQVEENDLIEQDLKSLDHDEADVWRTRLEILKSQMTNIKTEIRAAANKARRQQMEKSDRKDANKAPDPPLEIRRA